MTITQCPGCGKWKARKEFRTGQKNTIWEHRLICWKCNLHTLPIFEALDDQSVETMDTTDSSETQVSLQSASENSELSQMSDPSDLDILSPSVRSLDFRQASDNSHDSAFTQNSTLSQVSSASTQANQNVVFLPSILTIPSTEKCCFLCKRTDRRSVVPDGAVRQAWREKNVFLSKTTRCCPAHLSGELFSADSLNQIEGTRKGIYIDSEDLCKWILELTNCQKNQPRIDFSVEESLTDADYETLLPCPKYAFNEMTALIQPRMRNSVNRHPANAIAMFLMQLRLNISQKFLAFLFRTEQPVVSLAIQTVSDLLLELHTPQHLGYTHMSRELAIQNHSRVLFNELFSKQESLFLIVDATYINIERPGNFEEQRLTYSLDKKRNLYKPTLLVLPDGYILECSDMCFCDARNNDATILKYLFATTPLSTYVEEADVMLVDRGYRDAKDRAEQSGLEVFMPHLLQRGGPRRLQFTTQEGNETRRITACRFVVEIVNGRLKNVFPFFAGKIEAPYKSSVGKFFKVACGIMNAYHPPIFSNSPQHQEIAHRMLGRMELRNLLKERIELNGWNCTTRNANWSKATATTFQDFPVLSLQDIQELTHGPYQLSMALRYTKSHMNENADYEIFVHEEAPRLIRAKLHSRFSNVDKHNVWVEYSTDRVGILNVLGHYCTCKNGARVVGTCSHVTSVIRYLGHDRHQRDVLPLRQPSIPQIVDARVELERLGLWP